MHLIRTVEIADSVAIKSVLCLEGQEEDSGTGGRAPRLKLTGFASPGYADRFLVSACRSKTITGEGGYNGGTDTAIGGILSKDGYL